MTNQNRPDFKYPVTGRNFFDTLAERPSLGIGLLFTVLIIVLAALWFSNQTLHYKDVKYKNGDLMITATAKNDTQYISVHSPEKEKVVFVTKYIERPQQKEVKVVEVPEPPQIYKTESPLFAGLLTSSPFQVSTDQTLYLDSNYLFSNIADFSRRAQPTRAFIGNDGLIHFSDSLSN